MKIKLLELRFLKGNKINGTFSSDLGIGFGYWNSSNHVKEGMEVEVELDIPGTLCFGKDIVESMDEEPKLYISMDKVNLIGRVEQIEYDNIIAVRLGHSILLLEVDDPSMFEAGRWIKIQTNELQITDFMF
ncbi:hypothetical protein J25TS5_01810 [Paenibacillus faecis]|uniref:hypothetical protein n=1 Tax=Paenibacillus faecis TaxID=862114 RepID=UPI001B276511|nr:hypothetical protein [Paenibacillus faecis]GIO83249.1 hypothetical protein J25TS5_01810 [Paenibacillus faecis]